MDEKTRILISLGAATAANCVPCFHNYFTKANTVGLTGEEIKEAADIGDQVKKGARILRLLLRESTARAIFEAEPGGKKRYDVNSGQSDALWHQGPSLDGASGAWPDLLACRILRFDKRSPTRPHEETTMTGYDGFFLG